MVTVTGSAKVGTVTYAPTATFTAPPAKTGFPDATNTGPRGTLTPYSGNRTITTTVTIQDQDITGVILVGANGHLTLRNCRVTSGDYWPVRVSVSSGSLLIEDCELKGGLDTQAALSGYNITARRINIWGCTDGIKVQDNSLIEDSYIHGLTGNADAHYDSIDILGSNVTVRHCTIENSHSQTSCVSIEDLSPAAHDITVEGNYLAGGGYTTYGSNQSGSHLIKLINNKYSTKFFPKCGYYGPEAYWTNGDGTNVSSGNTWIDGPNVGKPVT